MWSSFLRECSGPNFQSQCVPIILLLLSYARLEFYQKNFFIALNSYAQFQKIALKENQPRLFKKTFFLEIGLCKDVLN